MEQKGIDTLDYIVTIKGLRYAVTDENVSFTVKFYTLDTPFGNPTTSITGTVDVIAGGSYEKIKVSASYEQVDTLPDGNLYSTLYIVFPDGSKVKRVTDLKKVIEHGV